MTYFTPDIEDRRRLAIAELGMVAEANDNQINGAILYEVVRHHTVTLQGAPQTCDGTDLRTLGNLVALQIGVPE